MPQLSPSAGCVLVLTLLFSQVPRAGAGALAHSRAAPCPPGAATAGCGTSACVGAACAGGAGSADGGARLRDPLFQPSLLGHLAPAGAAPSTAQPLLGFFRRLFGGAAGRGDGTSRKLLGERKERGHRLQDEARPGDALFHAGVPEFEASGFAKRAADGVASDCRALGADRVAPAYRSLDRVFVFDWAGVDANGLGNIWQYFTHIMTVGVLTDRAAFSKRNVPGCGNASSSTPCRMDPGQMFGGPEGLQWAWDDATSGVVRTAASSKGFEERVLRPTGPSPLGWKDSVTGQVYPPSELLPLLRNPGLEGLPWITVSLAPADGIDPWTDLAAWPGRYHRVFDGFQDPSSAALHASWGEVLPPLPPPACAGVLFGAPSPLLQAALLPTTRRADAARSAGGRVAFVHVRTYAVDATMNDPNLASTALASAASGDTAVPPVCLRTPRSVIARGWGVLNDEAAPCGVALACSAPSRQRPPTCAPAWPTDHDAAMGPAMESRGASCAWPGWKEEGGGASGGEVDLFEGINGTFTSLLACAAAASGPTGVVFVATDLAVLSRLAGETSDKFIHGDGAVGHVGDLAAKSSGAWTRAAVDFVLAGEADVSATWGMSSFPFAAATRSATPPASLFRSAGLPSQVDVADHSKSYANGDVPTLRAASLSMLYVAKAVEHELDARAATA